MIRRDIFDSICRPNYIPRYEPTTEMGLNTSISWDVIAKLKHELIETIMNKIMDHIKTKASEFIYESSKPKRINTDLFGFDRKKPSVKDFELEVTAFLNGLVERGVIYRFQSNIFGEGKMSEIHVSIIPEDGARRFAGSVNLYGLHQW